jgi:hypothetical protein
MISTEIPASDLANKLESLAANCETVLQDDATRRRLRDAARNLSIALEMPGDTVHRVMNTVRGISIAEAVGWI